MESSVERLDKLIQEEARMATAQLLKVTHTAANNVDEMKRWSSHNCIDFTCVGLNHSYREPITTGPSKLAFSTRSLYESQQCVSCPS